MRFKYRYEPVTITVMTLVRDNSSDYLNLTNLDLNQFPLTTEIFGTNYSTHDWLAIQNINLIDISEDTAPSLGDYCLFSFPIQIKLKPYHTLQIGQGFNFEKMSCKDCIENTILIQNFGGNPINNFFARFCIDGIIKEVTGDALKKDGLQCVEVKKLRLDFGEKVYGRFSVIDYKNKKVNVKFEGAQSDEQGKISDYNYVNTVGILRSNCEAKNVTNSKLAYLGQ